MASKKTLEHYLRQMRLIEEHREKWCEENIRRHYRDLSKDLNEFLGVQYAALAVDDKLTYEILHGKAFYARFLEEVEQRINKFSPQAAQEIRDTVQLTYEHAYKGMIDAVEKSGTVEELHNQLKGIRAVRPETIKNVVRNKFMEKALEKNHKNTIYEIKKQIGIGLSQGDRMSTMAKRLSTQVEGGYKKAMLIARTEVHRAREAGYQDSSERMSQILKENDSDYVLVKTWKTMQDMSVRPYRSKGKKGKKTFVKGKGPDHVKMHGVTILVEEEFELETDVTTKTPGQSGVAGHDCNCRCYLSRDLMTKAEYAKLSGKKTIDKLPEITITREDASNDWFEYEKANYMSEYIRTGELPDVDMYGNKLSNDVKATLKTEAELIQSEAESIKTEYKTVYRGMVMDEDEVRAMFTPNEDYVFDTLSATSSDKQIAKIYSDVENAGGKGVPVILEIQKPDGIYGFDRDGLEIILPKGSTFKVKRNYMDEDGVVHVSLYAKKGKNFEKFLRKRLKRK